MRRTFWLQLKPFSINAYTGGNKAFKTAAARDWDTRVFHALGAAKVQESLKELRTAFSPSEHMYAVSYTFYYPATDYFTRAGEVSTKTFDITNVEKTLTDLLFLPKYHVQAFPYGVPNLNVDDKFLRSCSSTKLPSADGKHWIRIGVRIVGQPKLGPEAQRAG